MLQTAWITILCLVFTPPFAVWGQEKFFPKTQEFIAGRVAEFDQISAERKKVLAELAKFVQEKKNSNADIKILFVCKHNSRRSLIAQAMGAVAAEHFNVKGVETHSGGTESTELNARVVAAFERIGLSVTRLGGFDINNARHLVRYAPKSKPMVFFSKKYDDKSNPKADFCAVMTCAEANEDCPNVPGATVRLSLPYIDPKQSDGTADEEKTYDEKCREIAREMLYTFSLVR